LRNMKNDGGNTQVAQSRKECFQLDK